jgi:hypothetical protein
MDVLRAASPDDPSNAVLVGLCSGGFQALEIAVVSKVRGVCAVNPILTFMGHEDEESDAESARGFTRTKGGMKGWVARVPAYDRINGIVKRLPSSAWWIINRIAVDVPAARKLAKVVDAGVDVFVVAGTDESRWLKGGEGHTLRKMEQTGRFHMEVISGLEHSLFEQHTREMAVGILTDHVVQSFGPRGHAAAG